VQHSEREQDDGRTARSAADNHSHGGYSSGLAKHHAGRRLQGPQLSRGLSRDCPFNRVHRSIRRTSFHSDKRPADIGPCSSSLSRETPTNRDVTFNAVRISFCVRICDSNFSKLESLNCTNVLFSFLRRVCKHSLRSLRFQSHSIAFSTDRVGTRTIDGALVAIFYISKEFLSHLIRMLVGRIKLREDAIMKSVAFAESVQYTLGTVEAARRVQQDTGEQLNS